MTRILVIAHSRTGSTLHLRDAAIEGMVEAVPDAEVVVRDAANATGLRRAETLSLNSMIRSGEQLRLGDLRALGEGFPLRGSFRIIDQPGAVERDAVGIPLPGTVWMSQAGAETLDARIGDTVGIGESQFRLVALVVQEPDASLDYFNVAPKAFLNLADKKKEVYDEDLESLINERDRNENALYTLEAVQVSTGFPLTPTATLTLKDVEGVERSVCEYGTGPIDAVYKAVN